MSTTVYLNTEREGHTLFITLNRPEKHNCFGIPELDNIKRILQDAETDKDINTVVFRGAGKRSFSTGADLKQFTRLDKQGTIDWIRIGHNVFNYIDQFPKPTIAMIQGYALGGGLELALACDFRIASEKALLGNPELQHGWLPGWGGIQRLKKLIGVSMAKELIFFAEPISAEDAYRIGLIHKITTPEDLESTTNKVLEKLNKLDPNTFAMAKAAFSRPAETGPVSESETWFDILATLYARDK
jgi:enoyl-CoA hydratase/carnithine racemase